MNYEHILGVPPSKLRRDTQQYGWAAMSFRLLGNQLRTSHAVVSSGGCVPCFWCACKVRLRSSSASQEQQAVTNVSLRQYQAGTVAATRSVFVELRRRLMNSPAASEEAARCSRSLAPQKPLTNVVNTEPQPAGERHQNDE